MTMYIYMCNQNVRLHKNRLSVCSRSCFGLFLFFVCLLFQKIYLSIISFQCTSPFPFPLVFIHICCLISLYFIEKYLACVHNHINRRKHYNTNEIYTIYMELTLIRLKHSRNKAYWIRLRTYPNISFLTVTGLCPIFFIKAVVCGNKSGSAHGEGPSSTNGA